MLAASEKEMKLDITALIPALQKTIDFERELTVRFKDSVVAGDITAYGSSGDPDDDPHLVRSTHTPTSERLMRRSRLTCPVLSCSMVVVLVADE